MVPAQQGLGADQAARADVQQRLVVQAQFTALQRAAQGLLQGAGAAQARLQVGGEEGVAAVVVLLGLVHGGVGVAHQGFAVHAIAREHGDAHRGADVQGVAVDLEGLAQRRADALGHLGGLLAAAAGQRAGEFIATLARQGVLAAQQGGQALGHGAQQRVADPMAKAVVDDLETIQVHEQQRQRPLLAAAHFQRQVDAGGEQGAVGQVGQHVVMGQALDAPLIAQPLGDVAGQQHVAGLALLAQGRHGQFETARLSVPLQMQLTAGAGALAAGFFQRQAADLGGGRRQQRVDTASGDQVRLGRQAIDIGGARVVQAQQAGLVVQFQQQVGDRLDHRLDLPPAGAERPVGGGHRLHEHRPVEQQVGQHLVGMPGQVVQVGHLEVVGEHQLAEHRQAQGSHQQRHVELRAPAQTPGQQGQGHQAEQDDAELGGELDGRQALAGDEGARQPVGMRQEHPVGDADQQQGARQAQGAQADQRALVVGGLAERPPGQQGHQQQGHGRQVARQQPEMDGLFRVAGREVIGHALKGEHVREIGDGHAEKRAGHHQDVALPMLPVGVPADGEDQPGDDDGQGFQQQVPGQEVRDRRDVARHERQGQQAAEGQAEQQQRQTQGAVVLGMDGLQ